MNENGRLCLPLLLDGATGTQYMKAGMPSGVCVEQWASEHPEVIRQVVCGYADAGSDIVYAPTFLANAGSLAAYGLEGQVSAGGARRAGFGQACWGYVHHRVDVRAVRGGPLCPSARNL